MAFAFVSNHFNKFLRSQLRYNSFKYEELPLLLAFRYVAEKLSQRFSVVVGFSICYI